MQINSGGSRETRLANQLAAAEAQIAELKTLVEEAFGEGFQEGRDGGWIVGPDYVFKQSETYSDLLKLEV